MVVDAPVVLHKLILGHLVLDACRDPGAVPKSVKSDKTAGMFKSTPNSELPKDPVKPGLWRSVCSMIKENDSTLQHAQPPDRSKVLRVLLCQRAGKGTKAQSAFANRSGLSLQYFSANFSIIRSIFWALIELCLVE